MSRDVNIETLRRINDRLSREIGLNFPESRLRDLERGLRSVCGVLGLGQGEDCFDELEAAELSRDQVELLASHLTIGETYFFREPRSFEALEQVILPPLIEKRRNTSRVLRIWSAGCSSGEEPYSISILLQRMIPDWADWNILILATDINPEALRKAHRGVYRPWSFRGSSDHFRVTYFHPAEGGTLSVVPEVRKLVRFSYLNLADEEAYPSLATNTAAMDLIFCRNVLMYFSEEGVMQVGRRFAETLTDGGWLILSPSEASRHLFPHLHPVNFPGAIFFQKRGNFSPPERSEPTNLTPPATEPVIPPARPPVEHVPPPFPVEAEPAAREPDEVRKEAWRLFDGGRFAEAADLLYSYLEDETSDREARNLAVRALANSGRLVEALECVERTLKRDRLDVTFHYLKAGIQEEMGLTEQALQTLRGALFLDPAFIMAQFSMGNVLRQLGRFGEARQHFTRCLSLLETIPADETPPEGESLTAARIRQIVAANMRTMG